MPRAAKLYIGLVIATGSAILLTAAASWTSRNFQDFAIYLALVAFASTLKVAIPGLDGTMSPNFMFLLIGMTSFSFSEVIACAFAAAVVQSIWRPKRRVRAVQVGFSAACLVACSAAAFGASQFLLRARISTSSAALVIVAGSVYLALNTVLISTVISLAESRDLSQVWELCLERVFPSFLGGILLAGVVTGSFAQLAAWKELVLLLPTIVVSYSYLALRTRQRATN